MDGTRTVQIFELKTDMPLGKVRWFNSGKSYGFTVPNDGGDNLYAHVSVIETPGYKLLKEGQIVEFTIQHGPKGLQAGTIRALA